MPGRGTHALRIAMATVLSTTVGVCECAAGGWADSRTVAPFVCRADFSLSRMEPTLQDLARLQADLTGALKLPAPRESIEIYLFHDKATYTDYLSRYLPNVPYRRALYVKSQGVGRVMAYWSRDFEVDLRHECTHALLHASLVAVPLWLDEGLAQYFEVPRWQRALGHPNLAGIRWSLRGGPAPAIETLEKKTAISEMGRAEYRDSWAWVHFMLHGPPEAREVLVSYLADLHEKESPGPLSVRLQQRVADPEQQFLEHFRRWGRRADNLPQQNSTQISQVDWADDTKCADESPVVAR
ncbi:MAG: hypothetical protein ABR915_19430 [Thermoguttaceae bacterium]|jgi:hypothetical protein